MSIRPSIWILIFLFLFTNCSKEKRNTIFIEGEVYDPNTNEYVADAHVTIAASKLSSGGIFSSGFENISSVTTDNQGKFFFSFKEDKYAAYRISIEKHNYFDFVKEISVNEITPGVTYKPVYNLYPIGWIELKIRNAIPYDSTDYVTYSFTSGWTSGYQCCDNTVYQGSGELFADTLFCKTKGNQYVTLTYNVKKQGNTIGYTLTKFCAAFDTTYFDVLY